MMKEVAPSGPPVAATRPSSQRKRKATVRLGLGYRSYSGTLPKDLHRNLEQSETKGVGLLSFFLKRGLACQSARRKWVYSLAVAARPLDHVYDVCYKVVSQ